MGDKLNMVDRFDLPRNRTQIFYFRISHSRMEKDAIITIPIVEFYNSNDIIFTWSNFVA